MRIRLAAALPVAVLVVAGGCGGGGDSTGTDGIVQLVSVTTNVLSLNCGRFSHLASPDSLYMNVHLVNTSASNVAIDSIGSTGYISRASDQAVVGQGALNFTSLPFNPRPAMLQARTGDITLTVSVPMISLCAASTVALEYKDVTVSVRVATGVGQYVSVPMNIHVNYVGGAS
jgi:hypothetical protein